MDEEGGGGDAADQRVEGGAPRSRDRNRGVDLRRHRLGARDQVDLPDAGRGDRGGLHLDLASLHALLAAGAHQQDVVRRSTHLEGLLHAGDEGGRGDHQDHEQRPPKLIARREGLLPRFRPRIRRGVHSCSDQVARRPCTIPDLAARAGTAPASRPSPTAISADHDPGIVGDLDADLHRDPETTDGDGCRTDARPHETPSRPRMGFSGAPSRPAAAGEPSNCTA